MNKRHRTFIAINLPSDVKKVFARYQQKWADVPAKWTNPENLHITLVFLGDLTDLELGEVCLAVKEICEKQEAFNIVLNKIAYGPQDKIPPRYIWAGGDESKEAMALKDNLEDALSEIIKLKIDKHIFNAHITLARISALEWRAIEPEERPEIFENVELTFTVESIEIMESELTRQGPRYTVIESHQLQ